MKTLSLDLRERILASYDAGRGTRQDMADRYDVSLGMVKKLLSQRKRTGDIASRYHVCGRKPYFTNELRLQIKELIRKRKDITLEEIRETLNLHCSLPAIHYVLRDMNLSFKKNVARQRARARRRGQSQSRMDGRAKPT
jgi:transposase